MTGIKQLENLRIEFWRNIDNFYLMFNLPQIWFIQFTFMALILTKRRYRYCLKRILLVNCRLYCWTAKSLSMHLTSMFIAIVKSDYIPNIINFTFLTSKIQYSQLNFANWLDYRFQSRSFEEVYSESYGKFHTFSLTRYYKRSRFVLSGKRQN